MRPDDSLPDVQVPAHRAHRRWLAGLSLLVVLALTPVGWYVLSPLFLDRQAPVESPVADSATAGAVVARGSFGEVDAIHKGEGQAILSRRPDGAYSLRFEGFRVTNGPDLYVYLSGHAAPRSANQLHEIASLEVATLKGNVGDQSYELPASFDPSQFKSAVIYCKRFTTVFSTAELKPS